MSFTIKSAKDRDDTFAERHGRALSELVGAIETSLEREWYPGCVAVDVPISYAPHDRVVVELKRVYKEKGFLLTIKSKKVEEWSQRDNCGYVGTDWYITVERA